MPPGGGRIPRIYPHAFQKGLPPTKWICCPVSSGLPASDKNTEARKIHLRASGGQKSVSYPPASS